MLKYIIVFCFLSFCNADRHIVGDYDLAIFVQRYSVSSILFEKSVFLLNETAEFNAYLRKHTPLMHSERWVIHGLWPFKYNAPSPRLCESPSGIKLRYEAGDIDEEQQEYLLKNWPALTPKKAEEDIWATEFNVHGSCITSTPSNYFVVAKHLFNSYNIGNVLQRAQIYPGDTKEYSEVIRALRSTISTNIYIKCFPDENNDRIQHLLEVQLCLNDEFEPANCQYPSYDCDSRKYIHYPKSPLP